MNRERLMHLRDILAIPAGDVYPPLDMGSWVAPKWDPAASHDIDVGGPTHFCGTTACALGRAAFDPEFQKQGLQVWSREDKRGYVPIQDQAMLSKVPEQHALYLLQRANVYYADTPDQWEYLSHLSTGKAEAGSDAGRAFFGLTREETRYLFLPIAYPYEDRESYREYANKTGESFPRIVTPITEADVVAHIDHILNGTMPVPYAVAYHDPEDDFTGEDVVVDEAGESA